MRILRDTDICPTLHWLPFCRLLSEGNLTKTSSFEKFEKEYGGDRRFVALDDEAKLRRKEYNSYVSSLAGAENDSGEVGVDIITSFTPFIYRLIHASA